MFLGKILYELVELEVFRFASELGERKSSLMQLQKSLAEISQKCNTVLNCLLPIEHPTAFEEMVVNATKAMQLSVKDAGKYLVEEFALNCVKKLNTAI